MDILRCQDSPQKGVITYSTLGLSDHPIYQNGKKLPVRTEILGACSSKVKDFPNILSTCAFNVIKDRWFIAPGVIFEDIVKMYKCSKTLASVIFVPPFLWDDKPKTVKFPKRTVAWLLMVPISTKEADYARKKGDDALSTLFEKEQIDIFDINRKSVV